MLDIPGVLKDFVESLGRIEDVELHASGITPQIRKDVKWHTKKANSQRYFLYHRITIKQGENYMLSANIKISNMNYEKTFQQVFPVVKDKIGSMESKNMVIRLFQKLDDAALPVLLGVMTRLPEDTKNELLVQCLNVYSHKIREKLNEELVKNAFGKHLNIGCVSAVRGNENLYLWIGQVKVNYKALVKEKLGGKFGGMVGSLPIEKLEKMGIELLWTDENKQKLMKLAKSTLDKYGFVMELDDIQLVQEKEEPVEAIEGETHLELSDKMETDILDALAGYLKDKTANEVL